MTGTRALPWWGPGQGLGHCHDRDKGTAMTGTRALPWWGPGQGQGHCHGGVQDRNKGAAMMGSRTGTRTLP